MNLYLELLQKTLDSGNIRGDRTGTGTYSLFGERLSFDLREGFPVVTTKKLHLRSIVYELLWFISGSTNIKFLNDHGVSIWDEWADSDGELGPVYGSQWRAWKKQNGTEVDQLSQVISEIKTNPESRRLLVSSWNVDEIPHMALPPCHVMYQFYVDQGYLSCQMYQRSADLFLGVPFNIASYALLTHMVAAVCGLQPGRLIHVMGDVHLYLNHIEQAKKQLQRTPKPLPTLHFKRIPETIDGFKYEDIEWKNYHPYPTIKAPISI